jgi:hypothetical protein
MSLRIRRARRSDFPDALRLIEPDRALFTSTQWRALQPLLVGLIEDDRGLLCVVEETDPPGLRFLGGSAFLSPASYDELFAHSSDSILAGALMRQRDKANAFLNRRQIAEHNGRCELILLTFFGAIDPFVGIGASVHEAVSKATTAWTFFHSGYCLREIVLETASETQTRLFEQLSAQLVRCRPTVSGKPTWVYRMTRDEALARPAAWPFVAMVPPVPRFGFTRQQQQVLELALLDFSDREVMRELTLTEDSLKKRWRSIYRRTERIEPALVAGLGGADLRRALLQRLRHNLVELRPARR